jgi:serine/threonine protein kinase
MKVAIKEYLPGGIAMRVPGSTMVSVYDGECQEVFNYGAEQFLSEVQVLARFNGHPNIAGVKSFFNENNTSYYVMDYIEGISFKSYIKNCGGRIGYEDALRILVPVLNALAEVHQAGIIHRDVTPDNIYITKDGEIKLLDFGSARYSIGDKSKSLDVILKAGYAPREQYLRRGKQGPWTDVYSVAACFYASITGYIPPEALERVENDKMEDLTSRGIAVPAYLEKAILKGLQVNPGERFQNANEFLQTIKAGHPHKREEKQWRKREEIRLRIEEERLQTEEGKRLRSEEMQQLREEEKELRELERQLRTVEKRLNEVEKRLRELEEIDGEENTLTRDNERTVDQDGSKGWNKVQKLFMKKLFKLHASATNSS